MFADFLITFGTWKIQASSVNSDPSDVKIKAWAKVPVVRTGENIVLFRTPYTHYTACCSVLCEGPDDFTQLCNLSMCIKTTTKNKNKNKTKTDKLLQRDS